MYEGEREFHHSPTAVPIKTHSGSIRHDVIGFYNDSIEHRVEAAEDRAEATNNALYRPVYFQKDDEEGNANTSLSTWTQELHSLLREGRREREIEREKWVAISN
jgi:hypothetical protein